MSERRVVIPVGGRGSIEFHPDTVAITLITDDTISGDSGFIDIELEGQRQNVFQWMPEPAHAALGVGYTDLVDATRTAHELAVLKRLHRRVLVSHEQTKQQQPRFL